MDLATRRVNGYDMTYLESGDGLPLVLIHGSLCDYRYWPLQARVFNAHYHVFTLSLRHYYPERWDGRGDDFNLEQHCEDIVAFIDSLQAGPAHVVGHSRGGYLAFHLALNHPSRVRSAVLADPGGDLDRSLGEGGVDDDPAGLAPDLMLKTFERLENGDIDGALEVFIDAVNTPGSWKRSPEKFRDAARDNAYTLFGQVKEERRPYTREAAAAITVPTLIVSGANSPTPFPEIATALSKAIPGAERVVIDNASHTMNLEQPAGFNAAVLDFLQRHS
ncbi:MAG: alpha/beta hydrolase [Ectothiorhodospiraceae bacterium]|nr:alpha/beta hydrolase [Ectothiorhodospiraceae bacterium]MCH8502799.1 alpha/beta hydrolase [Ectothiorhodospiraceae bacterium]